MQLLYQAGQVGKTQLLPREGVYTDRGVFVPFSAVQLQTNYNADTEDNSTFLATDTQLGAFNDIDPGSGPFGGGSLYMAIGPGFPYQDYVSYNRASQQGLGGATEFTIDAWIKPEAGRSSYIGKGVIGQFTTTINSTASQYMLYINGVSGTKVGLAFLCHRVSTSLSQSISASDSNCLIGQWNHIRVSYYLNAATGLMEFRWFVNGVLKITFNTAVSPVFETANTVPHQVGILYRGTAAESRFPGWIGPLRVIKGYALNSTDASIAVPTTYFPIYS
jgi:hypothetical protein